MSYDLFLFQSGKPLERDEFLKHFAGRTNYTVQGDQAEYGNNDTGVYFLFNYSEGASEEAPEARGSIAFNINYCRPSFFIREAEPHVTLLIKTLDLAVLDPQLDGMGDGPYDRDLLVRGWDKGNEFGYSAIVVRRNVEGDTASHNTAAAVLSLPSERLMQVWRWNFDRDVMQRRYGENVFVPVIFYLMHEGALVTAVVWTDGVPMFFPKVDTILVVRDRLAPRRFLSKKQDFAVLTWPEMSRVIRAYGREHGNDAYQLDYNIPPKDVVELIEGLSPLPDPPQPVRPDQVLDREIVERVFASRA